jgi:hypothetical protein
MATLNDTLEKHHQAIIFSLLSVIALFLAACSLHDIIPICHYVFGCDHSFHSAIS